MPTVPRNYAYSPTQRGLPEGPFHRQVLRRAAIYFYVLHA